MFVAGILGDIVSIYLEYENEVSAKAECKPMGGLGVGVKCVRVAPPTPPLLKKESRPPHPFPLEPKLLALQLRDFSFPPLSLLLLPPPSSFLLGGLDRPIVAGS